MISYYNENDLFAATWLRNLIDAGKIARGIVDERSIKDVKSSDLKGFAQHHFFAGIGGWSLALRTAGWPDNKPVWTGSCPCQPFSLAGKQKGFDDERHLWPIWYRLICERRPAVVFGEQVAGASAWVRLVRSDMEAVDYAVGCLPIQAASAGADHLRDRFWFVGRRMCDVGIADGKRPFSRRKTSTLARHGGTTIATGRLDAGDVANNKGSQGWFLLSERTNQRVVGPDSLADGERSASDRRSNITQREAEKRIAADGLGNQHEWVTGADGKSRRVKPGIRLLAHGIPGRVGKLRGFGNAIDPRPAAAFIKAYMDFNAL